MTTQANLRPEQEALLLKALEKTAEYIDAGDEPNAALAKTASELDVPSGHLPLLVYAYNTARTQAQLNSGDDPLEKSADFALASLSAIQKQMYPEHAKVAAAPTVSVEYAFPPTWYKPGMLTQPDTLEKAAEVSARVPHQLRVRGTTHKVQMAPVATAPALADLPEEQAKARQNTREKEARVLQEMKTTVLDAELRVRSAIEDLEYYFQKIGSESFPRIKDNVDALFGDDVMAVMNYLENKHPEFAKQAMTPLRPVNDTTEPYRSLAKVVQSSRNAVKIAEAYTEKVAAFDAAYPSALEQMKQAAAPVSFFDGPNEKQAGNFGPMVGTALGITATREAVQQMAEGLRGPDPESKVRKYMDRISSPEHEIQLRNIQLQSTLQELMATDPIIKAHNPQTVINSFNELSQLAPRIASQPAMLRSVLRKQLEQQHMEPFELGEIAKMEQTLTRPTPTLTIGGA